MDKEQRFIQLEALFDKYKGRIYMEYERTNVEKSELVCVFQQDWDDLIVEILATLPSEKEIVKGVIEEYAKEHPSNKSLSCWFFERWLDQEAE